jgi:hypothetical protein
VKTGNTRSTFIEGQRRLDARYFLSPGRRASEELALARAQGLRFISLGGKQGAAKIWQPTRFKLAYAAPREEHFPYLRPYDVFEYLPRAADYVSSKRNPEIQTCRPKNGAILQTCSGRNLGPAVITDTYLERFAVGSDMLRIEIDDKVLRLYVLAYLQTRIAQALLTQGKTGSVIDHLSPDHIGALEIPLFENGIQQAVAAKMELSTKLREEARLGLAAALNQYEDTLPRPDRRAPLKSGWSLALSDVTGRLDAASYDPLAATVRDELRSAGGKPVATFATVLKPPGRYKTYYVAPDHGRPILSGAQILQCKPINLRFISERSFKDASDYQLRRGWIAYQADGRSEEALGIPILVTSDRDGWLASGHVGRLVPTNPEDSGWLYLAARTWCALIQVKALASGSVVDATFPADMNSVVLPPKTGIVNSAEIREMWDWFARAQQLEDEAVETLEKELSRATGAQFPPAELPVRGMGNAPDGRASKGNSQGRSDP